MVTVVLGMQWGDEGKGKITDYCAGKADVIARCAGGDNAGHTIYDSKGTKYVFHVIPSGALYENKDLVIGNGVVLNPKTLSETLDKLAENNYNPTLCIDPRTHIIMPWHIYLDGAEEKSRRDESIGTTKKGIGPTYMTKAERKTAIRFEDFTDEKIFREKVEKLSHIFSARLQLAGVLTCAQTLEKEVLKEYVPLIKKLSAYSSGNAYPQKNVSYFLDEAIKDGLNILVEGAQGALLDIDHGTFDYVTSYNPTIGGALTGLGIAPQSINKTIGVMKAYTTRVGNGPFPTRMESDLEKIVGKKGNEFGATTGRPRNCGWLDLVALKHAAMINGTTGLAITKLDILDDIDPIKICTSYELDNEVIDQFPAGARELEQVEPIFAELDGWEEQDWSNIKRMEDLPRNAQVYLNNITAELNVPLDILSVGPNREETIVINEPF